MARDLLGVDVDADDLVPVGGEATRPRRCRRTRDRIRETLMSMRPLSASRASRSRRSGTLRRPDSRARLVECASRAGLSGWQRLDAVAVDERAVPELEIHQRPDRVAARRVCRRDGRRELLDGRRD